MTLDKFMAELDDEEATAQREAVAAIKQYDVERSNERTAKAQKDGAGVKLRNYFITHPDEKELVDSEWGLKAFMQFGGRINYYDPPSVIKAENPKLWARLEELGVFRIDPEAVEKAVKEGALSKGDLFGHAHEGERTPSLQVKPLK